MDSPLRWPGGKSRLAEMIVSLMPPHQCYVEPFCGGAWVFFAKPRELSKAEVLNDLDGELVNLYRVLQSNGSRLIASVDRLPYARAVYNRLWRSRPRSLFARARRFWYLNRAGFGGLMDHRSFGTGAGRRFNTLPARLRRLPEELVASLRGVILESRDALDVLRRYDRPSTFFFVDPPYLGHHQPYIRPFGILEHRRLAEALGRLEGKFVLTIGDRPAIRRLYRGLPRRSIVGSYTIANGTPTRSAELLIANFPLPARLPRRRRLRRPDRPAACWPSYGKS